jgi:hypothetical protein
MAKNEETRAVGDGAQLSSSPCPKLYHRTRVSQDADSSDLDSLECFKSHVSSCSFVYGLLLE